jgi:uncharacterized repeat protein (TIGR01451 family)
VTTTTTPVEDGDPASEAVLDEATDQAATGDDASASGHARIAEESETEHWRGVAAVVLLGGGLGVLTATPPLVLAGIVGVGYLAYARVFEAPTVDVAVSRAVDDADPDPGDEVTVTVTVENTGDATLPDLRLVDGVPDALEVVDGTARLGTALRPGATASFDYTVLARRGEYEFDHLLVVARDYSGARQRRVEVATAATLSCTPSLDTTTTVPLRGLTSQYTGRVDTRSGGEGIEFFATRDYRTGDPMSRIDWNRLARDGDLGTLEFREERMATVVLLLDLRTKAYVQAGSDGLHAVDKGVDAAGRLFSALLETGDRVGIAGLAPEDVWLAPGSGNEHRARAQDLLATHPSLSPTPPERYFSTQLRIRKIRKRLPADAQLILLSPLADDDIARHAQLFHAHGHLVTCVSPNPTTDSTPGHALAAAERSNRISVLRQAGIRVVDWRDDESLAAAMARTSVRWSP